LRYNISLPQSVKIAAFKFLTPIEEKDIVFSNHMVSFALKNGSKGKSRVIAEFWAEKII
jgi:hypothetical protein